MVYGLWFMVQGLWFRVQGVLPLDWDESLV